MITAYSARTGTIRNLDALRAAGWRILVCATGEWRNEGMPYAIDNGAWTAHQTGAAQLDVELFLALLLAMGAEADWCAAPDIVGGGRRSLALSLMWLSACLALCRRVLIPVQEGIEADDVRPFLHPRVGIFVDGAKANIAACGATPGEAEHALRQLQQALERPLAGEALRQVVADVAGADSRRRTPRRRSR